MHDLHNKARGEVMLSIDGRARRLCLTLGALADLENAFDVVSLADLGERLSQLTAGDLLIVISALAAGGGEPIGLPELAAAQIEPQAAASAVAEAFRLAFDE